MSTVSLYLSTPHPCSYVEDGRTARMAFVDPELPLSTELYRTLLQIGFRRSGEFLYRPACADCSACRSCRVRAFGFKPNRAQRRCIKANQDLDVQIVDPRPTPEHFELYQRYLRARHADGEMDPDDEGGFERFLGRSWADTWWAEFREAGQLLAVMVVDETGDGLSAVYTFFDPAQPKRSLGRMAVLWLIAQSRERGLPYTYLGYWIAESRKMHYKREYPPLEILVDGQWQLAPENCSNAKNPG